MLSPFARAVAYYGAGGFAFALLLAAFVFDPNPTSTETPTRLRRRALWLASLGVLHPLIAAASLLLARDANRDSDEAAADSAVVASGVSLTASLAVMAGVLLVVA